MNIYDLLTQDGFTLTKVASTHGGEYKGPCFLCGGTDRLTVHPERPNKNGQYMGGRYICRQCGKYGDAISYLMSTKDLKYLEACHSIGIEPSTKYRGLKPKVHGTVKANFTPREPKSPGDLWQDKAKSILVQSYENLWDDCCSVGAGKTPKQWLYERGLTDQTIKQARLGWINKDQFFSRESWGLETVISEKTGKPKKLWIPRGLIIPYFQNNKVIRLRIRRPEPGDRQRYIVAPGSNMRPMVWNTGQQKVFVIVESELDGLLIHQEAGDIVGVVALGSAQAKPDRETDRILRDADLVLSCLDSDEAGAKANWEFWADTYRAERWPCISGKDPGEMYQAGGVSIRDWVQAGIPETHQELGDNETIEIVQEPETQDKAEQADLTDKGLIAPDKPNCQACPACDKTTHMCHGRSFFNGTPARGVSCDTVKDSCPKQGSRFGDLYKQLR